MAAFEDTFTETSDTLLTLHVPNVGTAWTLDSGDSSNLVVRALNNALVSTAVSRTFVRSDDLGDADCYVEAELSTLSSQNGRYVALRAQDSANFIGWILAGTGSAGMRLVKVVSANTTNLFTMQGVAGRVYRVEAEGTTIRFYEDGVQQGSDITESSFQTETKQGIVAFNTDSTTDFISTYNADVLGGGGTSVAVTEVKSNRIDLSLLSISANLSIATTEIRSSRVESPVISIAGSVIATVTEIKSSRVDNSSVTIDVSALSILVTEIKGSRVDLSSIDIKKEIDLIVTEIKASRQDFSLLNIPVIITINPKNIIRVKIKENTVRVKRNSNIIRVK